MIQIMSGDTFVKQDVRGLLKGTPFAKSRIAEIFNLNPNKEDKKVDAFSRKEEYILTEYIKTHESKYNLILLVALYTGMRIGEILALRPGDIHISGNIGSIEVKRTLTKDIHNKVVIGEITKTKNGCSNNTESISTI